MEEKMKEYSEILADNIKAYGVVEETVIAMEECAELIQAISKIRRYGFIGQYKDNLIEEIADVSIVICEIMMMFGIADDDLENAIYAKVQRLKHRMNKTEYAFDSNGNVWKL